MNRLHTFFMVPLAPAPFPCRISVLRFCGLFFFLLDFSKEKRNRRGGGREKNWLMFPLKHVTSSQLTAENNLGLQASDG